MKTATKQVRPPRVAPTIEPGITVGEYLDGNVTHEEILEVLAFHVLRLILPGKRRSKAVPALWWLPARQTGNE